VRPGPAGGEEQEESQKNSFHNSASDIGFVIPPAAEVGLQASCPSENRDLRAPGRGKSSLRLEKPRIERADIVNAGWNVF
jgi:hypothetical protein